MSTGLLLTGATGMIGGLVASALAERGVPFTAMVRSGDRAGTLPDLGAEVVEGDFDDPASLAAALHGVRRAFLLTNSTERTEAQQLAFVAAARDAGVEHLVKLSQLAASPDSPVRFLRYHAAVEAAVRESGVPWTSLRPNLVLQAYLPYAPQVAHGLLQAPIGGARVSVVDARDIAAVAATALTEEGHAGQVYDVTGPDAVTHAELAEALGEAAGHPVRFETVPPEAFAAAVQAAGMPPWQAAGLVEDYAHYDRGEAARVSGDVERVTGRPARGVAEFARDHADRFRSP